MLRWHGSKLVHYNEEGQCTQCYELIYYLYILEMLNGDCTSGEAVNTQPFQSARSLTTIERTVWG